MDLPIPLLRFECADVCTKCNKMFWIFHYRIDSLDWKRNLKEWETKDIETTQEKKKLTKWNRMRSSFSNPFKFDPCIVPSSWINHDQNYSNVWQF